MAKQGTKRKRTGVYSGNLLVDLEAWHLVVPDWIKDSVPVEDGYDKLELLEELHFLLRRDYLFISPKKAENLKNFNERAKYRFVASIMKQGKYLYKKYYKKEKNKEEADKIVLDLLYLFPFILTWKEEFRWITNGLFDIFKWHRYESLARLIDYEKSEKAKMTLVTNQLNILRYEGVQRRVLLQELSRRRFSIGRRYKATYLSLIEELERATGKNLDWIAKNIWNENEIYLEYQEKAIGFIIQKKQENEEVATFINSIEKSREFQSNFRAALDKYSLTSNAMRMSRKRIKDNREPELKLTLRIGDAVNRPKNVYFERDIDKETFLNLKALSIAAKKAREKREIKKK